MAARAYKKYMKKDTSKDYTLLKLFLVSFLGMLLIFTFIIKSFSPSVDVSIGDYKQETEADNSEGAANSIDGRLSMIQDEDRENSFSDLMKNADDVKKDEDDSAKPAEVSKSATTSVADALKTPSADPVYKVFIGTYTSSEQAKVAKDIIAETGSNLNPIIKCLGANEYTLQVGIFKNKSSAEALLYTIQQNHLPGRISQEY